MAERLKMIEVASPQLSIVEQCQILSVNRSRLYYKPVPVSEEELAIMRALDELYTAYPFYGARRMTVALQNMGFLVNHKRVSRLMREMGIEAIYPKPRTSIANPEHKVYPYLLRGMEINRPNLVWATDITYIRMQQGFVYLSAIMDWFSRYVVSWELSICMDMALCLGVLEDALSFGTPRYFNSDQGSQYTSQQHTSRLESAGVEVSMDGRGRYLDNIFVERLWRSLKYEEVYLKDYESVPDARTNIGSYIQFYNERRPHQALGYRTPYEVFSSRECPARELAAL